MTPHEFHAAVMAYCGKLGASVTSYGRTERHNFDVGGVLYSKHMVWLACDIEYDATPPLNVRKKTAAQLGIKVIPESDHDHLQTR